MSTDRAVSTEKQQATISIKAQEFLDFLNHHGPESKCVFCGTGEYTVGPGPDGEGALIVATPMPTHQSKGLWFFPASCNKCGYTAFFNAHVVSTFLKGI
jgi:hypothetical protein